MKKLLSIVITTLLFLGFSTSAFANDKKYEDGLKIIEAANTEIDLKIERSVEAADKLLADYLYEIRGIEKEGVTKLMQGKEQYEQAIVTGTYSAKEVLVIKKEIAKIDAEIIENVKSTEENISYIEQEIEAFMLKVGADSELTNEELLSAIQELSSRLNGKSQKYVAATNNYISQLDVVIQDCYNVTLEMSQQAIEKARKKGVLAECSWKLVRFGHKYVWIDPIRVVGRW